MIERSRIITHRGLQPSSKNYFSECSFEAFKDQLSRGFAGIEFDPNLTKDGIIVMHDALLSRPTGGVDNRQISEVSTQEVCNIPLANGHIPTLGMVMTLIKENRAMINAMHLKSRLQTPEALRIIVEELSKYKNIFDKFIVFDVKPNTARLLKNKFPQLRLAPSIAHPYDIERYNDSIGGTLMTIDDAVSLKKEGVIDGVWGDEWDTKDENGKIKRFYTKENFDRLHKAGLFIALVTPELHGTSPGLYGGESHSDSKDLETLFKRIKDIKDVGADYFCTDYPEEVSKL